MINPRTKGAAGEREFCRWLSDNLDIHHGERNLEQVRSGGADVVNCYPFIFEVKRVENLDLIAAWIQVKTAWIDLAETSMDVLENLDPNLTPVVAFRKNNKPWEFLISAEIIGNSLGFLRLNESTFKEFALNELRMYAVEATTTMAKCKSMENVT